MKSSRLLSGFTGFSISCFITAAQAGIPVWSFSQAPGFPTKTYVSPINTATVKYIVTNNSSKPHNLVLSPQTGVSQIGNCLLAPENLPGSTCTLVLAINGSMLPATGLSAGPVLSSQPIPINVTGRAPKTCCLLRSYKMVLSLMPVLQIWRLV